jgi:hypothetical protein
MLDNLNYEDYVGELNTKFQLAETSMEIELIEITERKMTTQQEMFSLIFLGAKDNFLEQKIYQMHHEKLGDGELFLVPIAEVADGYKYEAGFNRLIKVD